MKKETNSKNAISNEKNIPIGIFYHLNNTIISLGKRMKLLVKINGKYEERMKMVFIEKFEKQIEKNENLYFKKLGKKYVKNKVNWSNKKTNFFQFITIL